MTKSPEAWSGNFQGDDVEAAYAAIFGQGINGGFNDHGLDIPTGDTDIPFIQVKSSVVGAKTFLAKSLKMHQFIPIALGDPGAKEEMIESLKKFGGWVGPDIPDREKLLQGIAQVRQVCYSN
jgi:hypothetical protein